MLTEFTITLAALAAAAYLSVWFGKMDRSGGLAGLLIALAIYLGAGWPGLGLLFAFFLLGVGATAWRRDRKREAGLMEGEVGRRSAVNVLANGGVAAGLGLALWLGVIPTWPWLSMLAASLAAATSDTISSELGNVLGSRYVSITTGRPGRRGDDGVVSPEGTLLGLAAALLMAGLFVLLFAAPWRFGLIVGGCGLAGNLLDSWLGATWQRAGWLDNHQVNLLNTLGAALLAGGLTYGLGLG